MDNEIWWTATGEQVSASERRKDVPYYRPATVQERLGARDVVMEVLGSGGSEMLTDELPDAVSAAWEALSALSVARIRLMDNESIRQAVESVETGYVVGLRVVDDETTVGEMLRPSRHWDGDTQTPTAMLLSGTSAIMVEADSVDAAVAMLAPYLGDYLLVIYGERVGHGDDDGEILIRSARVAAVYAR